MRVRQGRPIPRKVSGSPGLAAPTRVSGPPWSDSNERNQANRLPRFTSLPCSRGNTGRSMKRLIVGAATAVSVSGGLGLAARFAQADPVGNCPSAKSCMHWCPGDPDPAGRPIPWDASVCNDFFWDSTGLHDVGTGTFHARSALAFDVPPPAGPVPTQTSYLPLPTLNFCPIHPGSGRTLGGPNRTCANELHANQGLTV
jgi:hypothetical protein